MTDTAANVAAAFDKLNGDSHINAIALTDSGMSVLNLTAVQAATDTAALDKISNSVFEVLAPGQAATFYGGGNGASGMPLTLMCRFRRRRPAITR